MYQPASLFFGLLDGQDVAAEPALPDYRLVPLRSARLVLLLLHAVLLCPSPASPSFSWVSAMCICCCSVSFSTQDDAEAEAEVLLCSECKNGSSQAGCTCPGVAFHSGLLHIAQHGTEHTGRLRVTVLELSPSANATLSTLRAS